MKITKIGNKQFLVGDIVITPEGFEFHHSEIVKIPRYGALMYYHLDDLKTEEGENEQD